MSNLRPCDTTVHSPITYHGALVLYENAALLRTFMPSTAPLLLAPLVAEHVRALVAVPHGLELGAGHLLVGHGPAAALDGGHQGARRARAGVAEGLEHGGGKGQ